jgi:plasmid maintenance system antidote protein VapI
MKKISSKETTKAAVNLSRDVTGTETVEQEFSKILTLNREAAADRIFDATMVEGSTEEMENENLEEMIKESPREVQNPSGVLTPPVPANRFRVTARAIESILIESIRDIREVTDYQDETEAEMPLVARTPNGDYLMDGRSLVERARAAGETSILCEVDTVAAHDETDLCLRKVAIRSQTRGGRARYAELARNAYKLELLLLSGNSDLRALAHGGRRTGEAFVGDQAKDVRVVLAERLGKSRNTINAYISHAKYISDEVMSQLVQGDKDKEFFEKFGRLKNKLIERLQEQRKTIEEITREVSALILQCTNEGFPAPAPAPTQPQPQTTPVLSIPQEDVSDAEDNEPVDEEIVDEEIPAAPESGENPVQSIKRSSLEVSSRLSQRIENANDAAALYTALIQEIQALTAIVAQIAGLANPDLKEEQKAA